MLKFILGFVIIVCFLPIAITAYSLLEEFDLNVLVYGPLAILSCFFVGHLCIRD